MRILRRALLTAKGMSFTWLAFALALGGSVYVGASRLMPAGQSSSRPYSWPTESLNRSDLLVLPPLELVSGAGLAFPPQEAIVVTAFGDRCPIAAQSVPLWNRIGARLRRASIPYVVIGCGTNAKRIADFARTSNLQPSTYFAGPCEEFGVRAQLNGGVRHYVLNSRSQVVAAWRGMPAYARTEERMLNQIVAFSQDQKSH